MGKSRYSLRSAAVASAPPPQTKTHAFNTRGYAMEDMPGDRDTHEIICAYQEQGKYFTAIQKALKVGNLKKDGLFKNDTVYSDREKGEPEIGVDRYLVVGYTPRVTPEFITKKRENQLKQKPVGNVVPDDAIAWSVEEPPVLVVAKILPVSIGSIQLFALLSPNHGLCTPHPIGQDIVYYRWEYRDLTTNLKERGPNWNKKVAEISIQPDVDAIESEKQGKYKRGKPISRLVFNPNISVANEIASLTASFMHSKDINLLQEAMDLIESLDEDIEQRRPFTNTGLRCFVEDDEPLDDDTAKEAANDFKRMWPSVEGVTANKLQIIKKALLNSDINLQYGLARAVIAEACWCLDEDEVWDAAKHDQMIPNIVATVRRIVLPNKSAPPISVEHTNTIISLVLAKLKEMIVAAAETNCSIKNVFGDFPTNLDINSIWGEYADAADTDTSRAAFNQALRIVVAGIMQREAGIGGMVAELVDRLEKLQLE